MVGVVLATLAAGCSRDAGESAGPCGTFKQKDAEALLGTDKLVVVPFDDMIGSATTTTPSERAYIKSVADLICLYGESTEKAGTGPSAAYQAGVPGQFRDLAMFKDSHDHDGDEMFDGLGKAAVYERNKSGDEMSVTVLEDGGSAFTVAVYHHPSTSRQRLVEVARTIHKRL